MTKTAAVYLGRLYEPGLVTRLTLRLLLTKTRKYDCAVCITIVALVVKFYPVGYQSHKHLRTVVGFYITFSHGLLTSQMLQEAIRTWYIC